MADLIDSMCMTWRHDFGLILPDGEKRLLGGLGSGMTEIERDGLRQQMRQLLSHHGLAIAEQYSKPAAGAQVTDDMKIDTPTVK